MEPRETCDLMVCTDCLFYIAYGELPEDNTDEQDEAFEAAIERNWKSHGWSLCVGDNEKDDEFSKSSCDCCGSRYFGARHHCVAIEV